MGLFRIALANLPFPSSPDESVALSVGATEEASKRGAEIVCFPECFVPGYRSPVKRIPPPDAAFLEQAWRKVGHAAAQAGISVILGTERIGPEGALRITAAVFAPDGTIAGFQDKVQLDPSEERVFTAGDERQVFTAGPAKFGVVICHEGWRYPETVRWAARRGAQIVFHPHFHEAEAGSFRPASFADPRNSFHEKAALCRAAENTCYFATVNCASPGSPSTSAVVNPDGTLLAFQPYGEPGVLVVDVDLSTATGLLASRCRTGL